MFRFRLQTVLQLRAVAERESAVALSQARNRAAAALCEHTAVEDALARNVARLHAHAGGASVGEFRNRSAVVASLTARVVTAAEQLEATEVEVSESSEAYQAAFRDRSVLDRLRERYRLLWQQAEARGDLSEMDRIALARFGAPSTSPEHPDPGSPPQQVQS
jgi:flagellar export protein FliJ